MSPILFTFVPKEGKGGGRPSIDSITALRKCSGIALQGLLANKFGGPVDPILYLCTQEGKGGGSLTAQYPLPAQSAQTRILGHLLLTKRLGLPVA